MACKLINEQRVLQCGDMAERSAEETQRQASSQLVRLIDFLFALVLAQGAVKFAPFFANPTSTWPVTALAIGLIYYTVIRSFVDWHLSMEHSCYRIMEGRRRDQCIQTRTIELWRVYVDFFIVAIYGFMLLKSTVLLNHPGRNITWLLGSFVVLFGSYLLWGALRDAADESNHDFSGYLLVLCLVFYIALTVAYYLVYSQGWLNANASWRNGAALTIALGLMVAYRYFNWKQGRVIAPS